MPDNRVFWRLALALAAAVIPGVAAFAGPITFTWDPSKATPALAAGPAAFSADTMTLTNYLRITNVNNLTTLRQTFSGTHIQTIRVHAGRRLGRGAGAQFQLRAVLSDQFGRIVPD